MRTFVPNLDQEPYDAFVSAQPIAHLLQSYHWADIKTNWKSYHTALLEEGTVIGAALVLVKTLPGGFTMAYIPRGPILDYENGPLVKEYLNHLKTLLKKERCLFVKMDPALLINQYASYDKNDDRVPQLDIWMDNLKQAGAIHQGWTTMIDESIQPRYQSAVLYGTDEQLEARLPKHTRRLIQDAVKRNVHIQFGHSELVPEFSRLVTLTEERKGVNLRNEQYFQRLMDVYGQDAVILLAMCNVKELKEAALKQKENVEHELAVLPDNAKKKRHRLEEQLASVTKSLALYDSLFEGDIPEGELAIAGILSINYGHTCEMLYAGMDERFKQFMPQYMEYMENFKWAFAKGMTEASMGGVEGTLDDGLTRFKDNFSPVIQEFIGEFDLPVNKLLYKPAKWAYEKVKHKMNQ